MERSLTRWNRFRCLVLGLAGLALAACGSSAASTTTLKLGAPQTDSSGWSKFEIASAPMKVASQAQLKGVVTQFPAGAATAYYTTPGASAGLFSASANLPAPPTAVVTVIRDGEAAYVVKVLLELRIRFPNAQRVTVNGATGLRLSEPLKSFPGGDKAAEPNADIGLLFVQQGTDVLYEVIVIEKLPADVARVLDSFMPLG